MGMLSTRFFRGWLVFSCLSVTSFIPTDCFAYDENFFWDISMANQRFKSSNPYESCKAYMFVYAEALSETSQRYNGPAKFLDEGSVHITWIDPRGYYCGATVDASDGTSQSLEQWGNVNLYGTCPSGRHYDEESGSCKVLELPTAQKGFVPNPVCSRPSSLVSDPVDFVSGNNLQAIVDYRARSLSFVRYYNSADGLWRSNYSPHLRIANSQIKLVLADGREVIFSGNGSKSSGSVGYPGQLEQLDSGWLYRDDVVGVYVFDAKGRLSEIRPPSGAKQYLAYNRDSVSVTSDNGGRLTFTQDSFYQPTRMEVSGNIYNYIFFGGSLVRKDATVGGRHYVDKYLYEDPRDPTWLTGIVDVDGVKRSAWSYDDYGRAITSESVDGVGKVKILYADPTKVSVVNELGKTATYTIQIIGGLRYIASILGEPSLNCAATNSSYTYDGAGNISTRTDAKGYVTTYLYNDRGLEISRTEASGTPQARVTTTEWDPTRFLRTKVVEPTRTTVYTYDDQGRETSRQVSAR